MFLSPFLHCSGFPFPLILFFSSLPLFTLWIVFALLFFIVGRGIPIDRRITYRNSSRLVQDGETRWSRRRSKQDYKVNTGGPKYIEMVLPKIGPSRPFFIIIFYFVLFCCVVFFGLVRSLPPSVSVVSVHSFIHRRAGTKCLGSIYKLRFMKWFFQFKQNWVKIAHFHTVRK